ncbi:hypothetical protein ACWDR0_13945 [Streptomyces sp. NPDC003691]
MAAMTKKVSITGEAVPMTLPRETIRKVAHLPGIFQMITWADASVPLLRNRIGTLVDGPAKHDRSPA